MRYWLWVFVVLALIVAGFAADLISVSELENRSPILTIAQRKDTLTADITALRDRQSQLAAEWVVMLDEIKTTVQDANELITEIETLSLDAEQLVIDAGGDEEAVQQVELLISTFCEKEKMDERRNAVGFLAAVIDILAEEIVE